MRPPPSPASPADAALALLHGAPSVVLARIAPEDPLGLRARVAARFEARALLFDLDRALLSVQASVALLAAGRRGESALGEWLEERVDEALGQLLGEDPQGPAPSLARMCAPLGLDGRQLELACRAFNRLPLAARRAFFALVLEGASPDGFARANAVALGELARRTRVALEPFRGLAAEHTPRQDTPAERRA